MPELPEVETTVRMLGRHLRGRKIIDLWIDKTKPVRTGPGMSWSRSLKQWQNWRKFIVGARIKSVRRRAKLVLIDFDNSKTLVVHLKMSGHFLHGQWRRQKECWLAQTPMIMKTDPWNGYLRAIFSLDNGQMLAFSDLRRFGTMRLVSTTAVAELKDIKSFGPEPLEESFRLKDFKTVLNRSGRIKTVLMNPTNLVGVGNIYSDEALWQAGVHPASRADKIPAPKRKLLYTSLRRILREAIRKKGSSNGDFRTPAGQPGTFHFAQKVYRQTGRDCLKKDGGRIQRIKVGGRSAHFCDKHQQLFK
ncbi:MAG: hypothetical protein COV31_02665 [Candidatus Yanofskybacteria bacterium CG10_big_fil_rev_8_21_14_0_10_46_23]|uniref:DNA-formamidopyrimidine glycosylase n=1 Tax=Candidatus Yanofskybacteria bacterium CG10_big_fil_rev_8_21_14_0_10_46_23 TaxID=1975098 RepID=A0A2H0R427_9BACT|nr:MAG: hypothetical protein COV31_02665 [Candidatus Yanofskybacteria bacterium CG10_big_fil_rev_8_21_14_0_10_46_23]